MSTIIVALILIVLVTGVVVLLVSVNNRGISKSQLRILDQFSKEVINNNLSISSQELFDKALIGLDGIQRKILIVRKHENDIFDSFTLDLVKIKTCSVKRVYRIINVGTSKKEILEKQLHKIVLHFELLNGEPVEFTFFDAFHNHINTMMELEQKAEKWKAILSKLNDPGRRQTA